MLLFSIYEETEKEKKKKPQHITTARTQVPLTPLSFPEERYFYGNMFSRKKNHFEQNKSKEAKKMFQNYLGKKSQKKILLVSRIAGLWSYL